MRTQCGEITIHPLVNYHYPGGILALCQAWCGGWILALCPTTGPSLGQGSHQG